VGPVFVEVDSIAELFSVLHQVCYALPVPRSDSVLQARLQLVFGLQHPQPISPDLMLEKRV
jgi:hypothetical protein